VTSVRNDGKAHQCRVCTKLHGNTSSHNTRNDLRIGGTSLAVGAIPDDHAICSSDSGQVCGFTESEDYLRCTMYANGIGVCLIRVQEPSA
jgi:hypothetical protein